ncbi:hypothetical protein UR09_00705 [Candidatus Nitromaritima sp. SCGC AAA799-A02]|nr:hypothetical protein UR09_00705 [Candidatus Nitromaritima sp. SCGC AAA799-A02]
MKVSVNRSDIELIQGDITESETDAIVNAANSRLALGAGVAGAIRVKGGPSIQQECDRIGGCPVGDAVATGGGNLKTRYVIHAVGPQWGEGDEDSKLKNATLNSLERADELKLASITFPALSTGIFGFPIDRAARIMLGAIRDYLAASTGIQHVVLALFDDKGFDVFKKTLRSMNLP